MSMQPEGKQLSKNGSIQPVNTYAGQDWVFCVLDKKLILLFQKCLGQKANSIVSENQCLMSKVEASHYC